MILKDVNDSDIYIICICIYIFIFVYKATCVNDMETWRGKLTGLDSGSTHGGMFHSLRFIHGGFGVVIEVLSICTLNCPLKVTCCHKFSHKNITSFNIVSIKN